jgi:regulatory protein
VSAEQSESSGRERRRRTPAPLDRARLDEMALRYVSRFATTRAKLLDYLRRKLRERGWEGEGEPDLEGLAGRFVNLGYVDDAAFARAKSGSLSARGYGIRRVQQALAIAGVSETDSAEARAVAESGAVEAAMRFARRRRIGPFAEQMADRPAREKALASMIRAGHSFGIARVIVETSPGEEPDPELLERCRS